MCCKSHHSPLACRLRLSIETTSMSKNNLPAVPLGQSVPQQLVFEVFKDLSSNDKGIDESPTEIGFKKANALFDVGEMGVLARRLLDVAYFFASDAIERAAKTGQPVSDTFDTHLDYFKWLMKYESNNHMHLKKCIREAQRSAIEVVSPDQPDQYISVPLLGTAGIANGRFVFQLPKALRHLLSGPQNRSFLSIRITAAFTTAYAHALYGFLLLNRDKEQTDWILLDELRDIMSATAKSLQTFKDFKRYALENAIQQINAFSDIFVTYETRTGNGTRKITHVRFAIAPNEAGFRRLLQSVGSARQEIFNILVDEFGLAQSELDEIVKAGDAWSDDRLLAAIEFTRHRCKGGTIKYPGAFLMKAIREGLKVGTMELEVTQRPKQTAHQPFDMAALEEADSGVVAKPQPARKKASASSKAPAREVEAQESPVEAILGWFAKQKKASREALFARFVTESKPRGKARELDAVLASKLERGRFAAFLIDVRAE